MSIRESSYGYWSSSRAFLWVAGGAAMGIGNVARLPYLMGEYGGVLFLAAYLLALFAIGLPLLVTEWMLGRWMRDDLVNGFARLTEAAKTHRAWIVIGAGSLICAALILSFYSVIAGWSAAYAVRAAGGLLSGINAEQARAIFLHLAQDPERSLTWHTLFMVATCIVVAHGVRDGIEHAAGRLVPAAFILTIAVCAYAMRRGDTQAALSYLLTPDLHKFGWRGAVVALHQAFFTLALGMGVMMALGSYLPANAPLKRLAVVVILMDTVFSLLAGLAIFALIFSAGLQPAPGLALIFEVLPRALPADAGGVLVTVAVFLVLLTSTLASAVTLLEPVARFLMDWQRTTRVFAAVWSALVIWFIGIASLLCFSILQDARLFGLNFFEWVQVLTSNWFAPACGLLLCIFAARIMPGELSRVAFGERDRWLYGLWRGLLRYPARIGLIVVLAYSAGLLGWLASLWSL
ncbi:MAG: sodium-dependent transporter [Nevskiaceae bacterium]|nr:MAG: sodium-dependent transporter [Nevskiaceae bacterium]